MAEEKEKNSSSEERDDVVFETTEEGKADISDKFAKLKESLKKCEKERLEYLDGWQRMRADVANMKKREEEERLSFVKFSREEIIRDLIPAMNSFHMAFGNKEAWEKVDLNWRMGVQYIYSQLLAVLEKHSVSIIEPKVGELFDANTATAIESIPVSSEKEDHTVREIVQKGYALHGKVLEPAKVKIGQYGGK